MEASGNGTDSAAELMSSVAGSTPSRPTTKTRRADTGRKWLEITFFAGPALLLFLAFVIYPVLNAVRYSFYNWNGISALDRFVGLDNYARALKDPIFHEALFNNGFIVVMSMAVQLPIALAIALLLNRKFRGRTLMRLIIFAPYILSEVITAVMWSLILQPEGPLNTLLEKVGLGSLTQLWLADVDLVIWTVFFVVTWKYVGLAIILFLAGLSGVPNELKEAAAIDGASWWQIQRRINIPLLAPTIRIWAFLSIIGSIQLFDMVWVLTKGGPAGASATIATYMFQYGFQRNQFGFGSAVAIILFLISLVAAIIYIFFVLRRDNSDKLQESR